METENDFIKYLIITDSVDKLITDLKDFGIDYSKIQLSDGNIVKIKDIIHDIEKWQKSGESFLEIMDELISQYCPMLEYYM